MMRNNRMMGPSAARTIVPGGDPTDDASEQSPPVQRELHPAYQFVAVDRWHRWKR
jgi:hypothetical protein